MLFVMSICRTSQIWMLYGESVIELTSPVGFLFQGFDQACVGKLYILSHYRVSTSGERTSGLTIVVRGSLY